MRHPIELHPMELRPTEEVVSRWVQSPRAAVETTVRDMALGRTDELRLDTPFERTSDRAVPTWRAHGRLLWHGPKLVRLARVEVDVTAWADDAAEVSVRPAGRRLLSWGPRREQRYFQSAHRAATRIADVVATRESDSSQRPTAA